MTPQPAAHVAALSGQRGFTLVELVVVMLLMGILGSLGMGRMADREPFALQAGADQLVSALRLAQATALAQRRTLHVQLASTPAAMAVCLDATCSQPLAAADGNLQWLGGSAGLSLDAAVNFSFNPAGEPSFSQPLLLQLRGEGGVHAARPVQVEAGSGLARQL